MAAKNASAARLVLSTIEALACPRYVVSPGGRSAPLAFALSDTSVIEPHVILDERQAGFFALGLTLGEPKSLPVLICTSGSAGSHYLPAIIEADYQGQPLFVITADRPNRLRGLGAAQTIDQRSFFGHHVAQCAHLDVTVATEKELTEQTADLVKTALESRTPVHLNIGFDEPLYDLSTPQTKNAKHLGTSGLNAIIPRGLEAATVVASFINRTHNGLLILGPNAVMGAEEADCMKRLISKSGWNSFAHATAGLPRSKTLGICEASLEMWLVAHEKTINAADAILYVGQAPTSRRVLSFLESHRNVLSLSHGRHLVQPWCSGQSFPYLSNQLIERVIERLRSDEQARTDSLLDVDASLVGRIGSSEVEAAWSGRLFRTLLENTETMTLFVGNSLPIRDLDTFVTTVPESCRIIANRGVNGIDGHISAAAGVAATSIGTPTVLVCGDLTAIHDIGALSLAAKHHLKIVIIDNDGGGIFEHLPFAQNSKTFTRYFTAQQDASIEAFGHAAGFSVIEASKNLRTDLQRLMNTRGPAMLRLLMPEDTAQRCRKAIFDRLENHGEECR